MKLFGILIFIAWGLISCGAEPQKLYDRAEANANATVIKLASNDFKAISWVKDDSGKYELGYDFKTQTLKNGENLNNTMRVMVRDAKTKKVIGKFAALTIQPKMKCCGHEPKQDLKLTTKDNIHTAAPLFFHAKGEWLLLIDIKIGAKEHSFEVETAVQ